MSTFFNRLPTTTFEPSRRFGSFGYLSIRGQSFEGSRLHQLKRLPKLHSLELYNVQVGEPGLRAVGRHASARLRSLFLQAMPLKDDYLRHLAALSNLRELGILQTSITGVGLASLANLPLERLELNHGQITEAGVVDGVAKLQGLRQLGLGGNSRIGPRALEALAALKNLEFLDLSTISAGRHGYFPGPTVDASAMELLLRELPALQEIDLRNNRSVTSKVETVLARYGMVESGRWTSLGHPPGAE